MRIISLGKLSLQLLCPLLYTLFCFLRSFAYLEDIKNPFIPILLSSMAELSLGMLELISIKRQNNKLSNKEKPVTEEKEVSTNHFDFLIQDSQKEVALMTRKVYAIIIMVSVFNSFVCFLIFAKEDLLSKSSFNFQNEIRVISMLYLMFLCYFIFKNEFHKHQVFSVSIISLFCFVLSVIWYQYVYTTSTMNKSDIIKEIIFLMVCDLFFSTKHTIEKWLMDTKFISPYRLLFLEGIFCFISDIIIMILFSYIHCFNVFEICDNINNTSLWQGLKNSFIHFTFILLFFFGSAGIELFITLTNKYFTPAYRPMFDIILTFISLLKNSGDEISNYPIGIFIIKIILYVLIMIACLIYNEIIILRFCGLDTDIKECIESRGELEYKSNLEGLQLINNISVK